MHTHDADSPDRPRALILAGGDPVDSRIAAHVPVHDIVIAADSGLAQAAVLGIQADIVIGDMDSVDAAELAAAEAAGAVIERYPADKDATDLELALERAEAEQCAGAVVLGGYGGRTDHLLGNALVLTASRFSGLALEWRIGATVISVVRPRAPVHITGRPGDIVSLLATGGPAKGVTTSGLRWMLTNATLETGSTRGVSNELETAKATVTIEDGVLLAIHERTSQ